MEKVKVVKKESKIAEMIKKSTFGVIITYLILWGIMIYETYIVDLNNGKKYDYQDFFLSSTPGFKYIAIVGVIIVACVILWFLWDIIKKINNKKVPSKAIFYFLAILNVVGAFIRIPNLTHDFRSIIGFIFNIIIALLSFYSIKAIDKLNYEYYSERNINLKSSREK